MRETLENTGSTQFTLTDRHGRPHSYVVTAHPAGEGMEIMYALLGLGAPALLNLAGAALKSEELIGAVVKAVAGDEDDGTVASSDAADLGRLLSGLDLEKVATELGRALSTGKAPELTRKVLSRTFRDGKALSEQFDVAYQGNYMELLYAVWRVCSFNGFFPVPSTSPSSPAAEAMLQ